MMNTTLDKILLEIEVFQSNAIAQRDKKTKVAGARARKASLELTKLFKEFRKESVKG